MEKGIRAATCFLLCLILFSNCKKDTAATVPDPSNGKSFFVSATSAGSFTKVQLQSAATLSGYGAYTPFLQYDVDYYKIIYNTTYNGSTIQASGLLGIPKNTVTTPALLSAQHGTIFRDADAPSNFPAGFTPFALFASTGFVTLLPDFIGYGVSKDIPHPYYDMQSSGLSVVDMITASKYYLQTQNKTISDKLFLLGYSEGGYVTMAAQKEIETNQAHKLTLTAAAEGAGGYDITGQLTKVATVSTYPDPSFFALFIRSYNTTYGFKRPYTDYFMPVYAAKIPSLLDGTKTNAQINSELSDSVAALLNTSFYNGVNSLTGETAFKAKVALNSFPNWYPVSPTRMYHGTADEVVFFETSQSTYDKFIAAGSKQLTLTSIPNGTHETSVGPMILDALPWLQSLAK